MNGLFQNNNGAIVKQMAKADMKHNQFKNIISGIVIALSACLLVASSVVAYNASDELSSRYSYHGVYRAVSEQMIAQLRSNPDIEKVGVVKGIGTAKNGATSMKFTYSDSEAAEFYGISVLTGTLPQNESEIALEKEYLNALGIQKNLGDTITLDFYNTATKQTKATRFKISGFVEMPQTGQSKRTFFTGIVSKQFADAASNRAADVMVRLSDPQKYSNEELKSKIYDVARTCGIDKENTAINSSYIDGTNTSNQSILSILVIATVILSSCFLVIYSVFYISVGTKVREYGQLRTLGTTQRQIKKIISCEGTILSAAFIPIGIIAGLIAAYLIFPKHWNWGIDLILACIVGAVTFLTVDLALRKPMRIAATVSPIEATVFNEYSNQKQTRKKNSLYLTPATLGAMNLRRNSKRTALTLLSLSLAGVLFVAVFTLTNSIHVDEYVKALFPYGGAYKIAFNPNLLSANEKINTLQADNPLDKTLVQKILSIEGIDGVEEHKEIPVQIAKGSGNTENSAIDNLTSEEAESLKKFRLEGNMDYAAMSESNGVLINKRSWLTESGFDFHVGDKIRFTIFDGNSSYQKELKVTGVMYDADLGATFLMTNESMDSLSIKCNSSLEVLSKQGYSEVTANQLQKLIEPYSTLYLDSFQSNLERYQAVFHTLIMAIRAFIVLISCFGLINLINTMVTGLLSRRKEFGLLRATGMTGRQLLKMMVSENFVLIIGTLLFAAPIGYGLGYLACRVIEGIGGTSYIAYQFSLAPILLIFAAMAIIQFVISGAAGRNLHHQNITPYLRENNQ
jgi:putative ABC transport system permease protein